MNKLSQIYPNDRVTLRDVSLRDGLQLVREVPSTESKIEWMRGEYAAGVRHFELGSFLPATRMPQFADIRDMITAASALEGAHSAALALNDRGATDAIQTDVGEIVCVVSATEEHSNANARRSRAEAIELVRRTAELARASDRRPLVSVGIAMAFGCSIAGEVSQDEVLRLAEAIFEAGADIVGIADTVGFAGPAQIQSLCEKMTVLCGDRPLNVHLHDTRGMGVANAAAALDAGARILDGSLGGLGGCPFAPGASGNVVMEDLVFLCESKGFRTGIDLDALIAVREIPQREMPGEPLHGAIARAGLPPMVEWRR
ncbi:hydroxymethylglutaryl-CoA lyase [Hwanghaeella sp.]|uniref:hydroxymethylglutaryl-CoA lyase n=1 Tax=Hwanghaeella sp. TaxID=2605943 RepID=UPI003CCB9994